MVHPSDFRATYQISLIHVQIKKCHMKFKKNQTNLWIIHKKLEREVAILCQEI